MTTSIRILARNQNRVQLIKARKPAAYEVYNEAMRLKHNVHLTRNGEGIMFGKSHLERVNTSIASRSAQMD